MKLFRTFVTPCLVVLLVAVTVPFAADAAREQAETYDDVVRLIEIWRSKLNGKCWNGYNHSGEASLYGSANHGILDASDEWIGLTTKSCSSNNVDSNDKGNYFNDGLYLDIGIESV